MASSSSSSVTDAWSWLCELPAMADWSSGVISLCVCPPKPPSSPALNLSAGKCIKDQSPCIFFSVTAAFELPLSLWTSAAFFLGSYRRRPSDENIAARLFSGMVAGVLQYGPRKGSSSRRLAIPPEIGNSGERDIFNLALLTLVLLVCIYEAPEDFRAGWIDAIMLQLASSRSRDSLKRLLRMMGSSFEEQWMKSVNLAIANLIKELHGSKTCFRTPSPFFSYAVSAAGMWKVQFCCPVAAMATDGLGGAAGNERLLFSLGYQQLDGVVQLAYKLIPSGDSMDVVINVDNVRCNISPLVSRKLMRTRGYGPEEKHFPSRVSLELTPAEQGEVLSVTASKSSGNPAAELGREVAVEGGFDPAAATIGLRFAAAQTVTVSMKPWKFEQSVRGATAGLHWILHGGTAGEQVVSSGKPPKVSLLWPGSWFRRRSTSAHRPFTKDGGVVFAGDEYGESLRWKFLRPAPEKKKEKTMEWEISGAVWVTYWPNLRSSFYSETRRMSFKEIVNVSLQ